MLLKLWVRAATEALTSSLGESVTCTARSPSAACDSTAERWSTRRASWSRSSWASRRSSHTVAHSMPTNQAMPGPSGRTRTREATSEAPTGPETSTAAARATVEKKPMNRLRARDIVTAAMSSGVAMSTQ